MRFDLDKFWEFVKEWTVGRLMVLLLLLAFLIDSTGVIESIGNDLFFKLVVLAVLLEMFELSSNHLEKDSKYQWVYIITTILPIIGVLFYPFFFFFNYQ